MIRKFLAVAALASLSFSALAVDEVALKATTLNPARTVLAPANAAGFSGTTTGGPEWVRPFADGTCCSGLGPVRYATQQFQLSADDTCDVSSTQNGWDGYLFVYLDPFNPLSQTTNFLAGDDDGAGGIGTSDIDDLTLAANTTYVVVTTGFENGEEGTFTNTISCPAATVRLGPFTEPVAVPSISAAGLAALASLLMLVGLGAVRVRRW